VFRSSSLSFILFELFKLIDSFHPHSSPFSPPLAMLPNPATSRSRHKPFFPSLQQQDSASNRSILHQLRARTRLTNLAVLLLISTMGCSLLLNAAYVLSGPVRPGYSRAHNSESWIELSTAEQVRSGIPLSIETTIERDARFVELDHLVMVPGHAIWVGHDPSRVEMDEEWVLEPMQRGGSVKTYLKHIRQGVETLRRDPRTLLVFSG
jgi:hypothetical protein